MWDLFKNRFIFNNKLTTKPLLFSSNLFLLPVGRDWKLFRPLATDFYVGHKKTVKEDGCKKKEGKEERKNSS